MSSLNNGYVLWALHHPKAAADLEAILQNSVVCHHPSHRGSEAAAQQQARLSISRQGAMSWRNNVGATQSACHEQGCGGKIVCGVCGTKPQQVRYGLSNDSSRLNEQIKSHDLVLAIPRLIGPEHVGSTIAQFGSVECKKPGWHYTGKGQEPGQAAWGALVQQLGGFATFATGEVVL